MHANRQSRSTDIVQRLQVVIAIVFGVCSFAASRAPASQPSGRDESIAPDKKAIERLIEEVTAATERAYESIPSARGAGKYEATELNSDGAVKRQVRGTFQMAFDHPREFVQFRYEPGKGHPDADTHARVVLSDGKHIYESVFCRRILPSGVEGGGSCSLNKVVSHRGTSAGNRAMTGFVISGMVA